MPKNIQIEINNEVGCLCPLHSEELKAILKAMLTCVDFEQMHLALYIVRDAEIIQLNKKHMLSEGPTNILSFPSIDNDIAHSLVLSIDTLNRECFLYGQGVLEHLVRLLAHGLGHVLGYEHCPEMFELCEKMEDFAHNYLLNEVKV